MKVLLRAVQRRSAARGSAPAPSRAAAPRSARPGAGSSLTAKVLTLADALGRPLRLIITAGQVGNITQAPALVDSQTGDAVLADDAYDSNALRQLIAGIGPEAVIPSNRCRKVAIRHDAAAYTHGNYIERSLRRRKHFRRFATQCPPYRPLHRLRAPRRHHLATLNPDPA